MIDSSICIVHGRPLLWSLGNVSFFLRRLFLISSISFLYLNLSAPITKQIEWCSSIVFFSTFAFRFSVGFGCSFFLTCLQHCKMLLWWVPVVHKCGFKCKIVQNQIWLVKWNKLSGNHLSKTKTLLNDLIFYSSSKGTWHYLIFQ